MAQELGETMLRASPPIVTELLGRHIEQGQALVEQASFIGEVAEHERWKAARHQWIELTVRTLGHIYDGSHEADSFSAAVAAPPDRQPWQVECKRDAARVREAVDLMISFKDRLELGQDDPHAPPGAPELEQQPTEEPPAARAAAVGSELAPAPPSGAALEQAPAGAALEQAPAGTSELTPQTGGGSLSSLSSAAVTDLIADGDGRVFLLHGRNDYWRQAVATLLERAGSYEVMILNEQLGERMTLAEQPGERSPGSRYAVILLTADDIGAPRLDSDEEPYYTPRAHQGVVFAMGLLAAALTPRCICVLYEDGVDLPCDMRGITYVRLDRAGGWQSKLLLGLRGAGFDYDMNALAAKGG